MNQTIERELRTKLQAMKYIFKYKKTIVALSATTANTNAKFVS